MTTVTRTETEELRELDPPRGLMTNPEGASESDRKDGGERSDMTEEEGGDPRTGEAGRGSGQATGHETRQRVPSTSALRPGRIAATFLNLRNSFSLQKSQDITQPQVGEPVVDDDQVIVKGRREGPELSLPPRSSLR